MKRLGLVVMLFAVLACGGRKIKVNGIVVYERYWEKAVSQIEPRAKFELDCPAERLEYRLIRRKGRHPVEVGVAGCGNRALYVRPTARGPAGSAIGSWRLAGDTDRSSRRRSR